MRYVNLNNGATSGVKPQRSIDAMINYLEANSFGAPGRGGSQKEGRIETEARISMCRLLNAGRPEQIIFTQSATYALNMAIHGLARPGIHVLTSSMEHNAVMRPLTALEKAGIIELSIFPHCNIEAMDSLMRENTRLIVLNHSSNVTGSVANCKRAAQIAKEHGAFIIVDGAQTAGIIDIDFTGWDIDVFVFTGHKSLMGPGGTGGFAVKKEAAQQMRHFITGGTGSASHLLDHPTFLPDKFEAGTPNTLGLLGLRESVEFILETGVHNIYRHEIGLMDAFIDGALTLPVEIYAAIEGELRTPSVTLRAPGVDSGLLSGLLLEKYGVITRSGLHCAPSAHKVIGSYPEGGVRFSFGYFNTFEEIDHALFALEEALKLLCPA